MTDKVLSVILKDDASLPKNARALIPLSMIAMIHQTSGDHTMLVFTNGTAQEVQHKWLTIYNALKDPTFVNIAPIPTRPHHPHKKAS